MVMAAAVAVGGAAAAAPTGSISSSSSSCGSFVGVRAARWAAACMLGRSRLRSACSTSQLPCQPLLGLPHAPNTLSAPSVHPASCALPLQLQTGVCSHDRAPCTA